MLVTKFPIQPHFNIKCLGAEWHIIPKQYYIQLYLLWFWYRKLLHLSAINTHTNVGYTLIDESKLDDWVTLCSRNKV